MTYKEIREKYKDKLEKEHRDQESPNGPTQLMLFETDNGISIKVAAIEEGTPEERVFVNIEQFVPYCANPEMGDRLLEMLLHGDLQENLEARVEARERTRYEDSSGRKSVFRVN